MLGGRVHGAGRSHRLASTYLRPATIAWSYIRFAADLPNECWQADFTHYPRGDGPAATSTGCPSTAVAPWSRANATAACNKAPPMPDRRYPPPTAKQVTHQAPASSSESTVARARFPRTPGNAYRGPTLVQPTG